MKVSTTITHASNGYVVNTSDENQEPSVHEFKYATDDAELHTAADVLYTIIEHMGVIGSKHDRARIYVEILPGSDYSGPISVDMRDTIQHKIAQYQHILDNCK